MDCVKALIAAHADANATSDGRTALMQAAANDNLGCLKALIAARSNVNTMDLQGYTALVLASEDDEEDCMRTLIAQGADVNAMSEGSMTGCLVGGTTALMLVFSDLSENH